MPTHSRVDVIGHAIRSVLDQTRPDFELLVVGDGCVAGTGEVVAGFGDPRIRFFDLPKAPHFGYANRNIALREARGALIGFAADDDLLFPDHLETLERGLAGGAALAYSQALWISTDGVAAPFLVNLEMADELDFFMTRANHIPASCFLYRADALPSRDVWPEDVPAAADLLLWRRIISANHGNPPAYCRTPTMLHFSARRRASRHAGMPVFATLLRIADTAEWWPDALRIPVSPGQTEQDAFAGRMRYEPGWTERVRRAAADVAARIAWDEIVIRKGERAAETIRDLSARLAVREANARRTAAESVAGAARVAELEAAVAASQHAIREIRNSTSWRITAPLRALSAGARLLFRAKSLQDRRTIPRRPTVALCLIAKNKGEYLAEWLAYNIVLGFDQILVYDNASTDSTATILGRARANDSRIRYFSWPDVPGQALQILGYNDALQRTMADWVAFIDIDEFIVLKEHDSIGDFLADFDEDTGAVCIHWLVFGSSGHETHVDDLVIRRFTQCARPDFSVNRHVKSIVRPSAVRRMLVHAPELSRGQYRSSNGRAITLSVFARAVPVVDHPAQINHYILKSREEYRVKTASGGAGYAADAQDRSSKFTEQFWAEHDRNETVDYAIVPMIPRVEDEIRRLMANNAQVPARAAE